MPTPQFDINNVLKRAMTVDVSTQFQPYSGVEIIIDDNTSVFAGDTSGRVLTINNAWGTQAQANNILEAIRGYAYQPYEAQGALLDPAAEIGDGVSVNDVYGGVYKVNRTFSSLMSADVSAPQSEEIDHEYPFESKATRDIARKFSAVESELSMTSNEIAAKVSKTSPSGQTSFSWSLQNNQWEVKSNGTTVFKITSSGAEVNGKITATSGAIGGFTIGSSAITYGGQSWNGTKSTGIYLGTSGIQLGSANGAYFQASSSGTVKAHNMTLTGTLNIGGSTITAAALRSGAQTAYNRSGTWNGTSTAWGNATGTSAGFSGNFKVTNLTATNRCDAAYMSISTSFNAAGVFNVGGITASWKQVTINGTTIKYLGRD